MCVNQQAMAGSEGHDFTSVVDSENELQCQRCCQTNQKSRLRKLQINPEECTSLCTNQKCLSNPWPSSTLILKREATEIPNLKKRRRKSHRESISSLSSVNLFPHRSTRTFIWRNEDALCWLDSALFLLVFCKSLRRCLEMSVTDCSLKLLCEAFDSAQVKFQALDKERTCPSTNLEMTETILDENLENDCMLRRRTGSPTNIENVFELMEFLEEDTTVKPSEDPRTTSNPPPLLHLGGNSRLCESEVPSSKNLPDYSEPESILNEVRETLWKQVQPKLMCKKGDEDSPVFALPLILRKNKHLQAHFRTSYRWEFFCSHCNHTEVTLDKQVLPSLKTLSRSLNVTTNISSRPCPSCKAPSQMNRLVIHSLPACPMFHFIDGLPPLTSWSKLDFTHGSHTYRVAGIIQYKQNPNHFVGWVKDNSRDTWLQGDDLKAPVVQWVTEEPVFPSSQAHVVMWERRAACWECTAEKGVAHGIKDAEKLDLTQSSRRLDSSLTQEAVWPEESSTVQCMEAYIPKGSKEPSAADLGGSEKKSKRKNGTKTELVDPTCETASLVGQDKKCWPGEHYLGRKLVMNGKNRESEKIQTDFLKKEQKEKESLVNSRYLGKSRPELILKSIPSQLFTPSSGSVCLRHFGKYAIIEKVARRMPNATSCKQTDVLKESVKRKIVDSKLAAKFAVFSQSLQTFAEYKQMVEGTRRRSHPPLLTPDVVKSRDMPRSFRLGSLSPMASPSGSSESCSLPDSTPNISLISDLDLILGGYLCEDEAAQMPGPSNEMLPDLENTLESLKT